jgi:hypothetical protein
MRFLLPVLSLIVLAAPGVAQKEAAEKPPGWEYRELHRSQIMRLAADGSKNAFEEGLNSLGAEGWEVITADPGGRGTEPVYLLKRPARAKANERLLETKIVNLRFARAAEMAKVITAVYQRAGVLRVVADERTNSVVLSADEECMKEVMAVIAELDREVVDPTPPKAK